MAQKKLQKDSLYEEYDLDGDGVVSDAELVAVKAIQEAETQEEKADAQRRMAWVSLIVMIIFTAAVFLPIFTNNRPRLTVCHFLYRNGWGGWGIHGNDCVYECKEIE